ncbi:MAG: hypothetical protein K9N49_09500 [Candidatus Marinimicrobia bacterium]|nr:hypothetical protein [Candidatus Neomarinimicrobiota bacterium]
MKVRMMHCRMRLGCALTLSAGLAGLAVLADDQATPPELGLSAELAWDSRYVTEGRSNLDRNGLLGATTEAALGDLTLGIWFADSPHATPYRELNAYALHGFTWGDVSAYVSFNHLRFLTDDEYDNEVGTGIARENLPGNLADALDAYYSFESEGAFFDFSLGGAYDLHPRLTISPSIVLGVNSGYVADGHDGANHLALALEASTPIRHGLELAAYLTHSWAISSDPDRYPADQALEDLLYGGVVLRGAF